LRILSAIICTAALLVSITPSSAQQPKRVQAGTLACNMGPSVGLIIGSHQKLKCVFRPSNGGAAESYRGVVNRLGLDLGITAGGKMIWGVYAPTKGLAPHALAGTYVGGSGDISLGVGVGANALVGGSNRTVALQPLSVEGQVGVNLALGIAGLRLE